MSLLHFIVRESPNVLDLRPGDLCWIERESYEAESGSLIQVFRNDFRWMVAWAPRQFFLPKDHYLTSSQSTQNRDFVFLLHMRRALHSHPKPYVSKPLLKGTEMMGARPWQFESVGEAAYFVRSRKIGTKTFTICTAMGTKLQHLFE